MPFPSKRILPTALLALPLLFPGPLRTEEPPRISVIREEFDGKPPWRLLFRKDSGTWGYANPSRLEPHRGSATPDHLEITFSAADSSGVRIYPPEPVPLEGDPEHVSVMVRGREGGGELFGDFQLRKGRLIRLPLGNVVVGEWRKLTLPTRELMHFPPSPGETTKSLQFLGLYFKPGPGLNRFSLDSLRIETEPYYLLPEFPWQKK